MSNLNEFTNSGAMVHLKTTKATATGSTHASYDAADMTFVLDAGCRMLAVYWYHSNSGALSYTLNGSAPTETVDNGNDQYHGTFLFYRASTNSSFTITKKLKVNGGETLKWLRVSINGEAVDASEPIHFEQWGY